MRLMSLLPSNCWVWETKTCLHLRIGAPAAFFKNFHGENTDARGVRLLEPLHPSHIRCSTIPQEFIYVGQWNCSFQSHFILSVFHLSLHFKSASKTHSLLRLLTASLHPDSYRLTQPSKCIFSS